MCLLSAGLDKETPANRGWGQWSWGPQLQEERNILEEEAYT